MEMKMATKAPAIEQMTSSVFDNGRRGNPRPGCDCEQCFGYCLVDSEKALRDRAKTAPRADVTGDLLK